MGEITRNISDCTPEQPPKRVENVGEEFITWAEQGWAFERIVSKGLGTSEEGSESCPYPIYRQYMINKINELVETKMNQ